MCALATLTLAAFDADLDRGVDCVTFCGPGCAASAAWQVGTFLPNVRALHTLCLRAVRAPTATESEEGPSRLAVWTRPHEGWTLRCMVLPPGIWWELEHGEWVRINLPH